VPAEIPPETLAEVQRLAVAAFRAIDGAGMARVDFFLLRDGRLLLNEVNTIPGFTTISMYPKLWEASGVGYAELVDRLIDLAIERHEAERKRGAGA
jgi:D-alanine-D-alanine ligase